MPTLTTTAAKQKLPQSTVQRAEASKAVGLAPVGAVLQWAAGNRAIGALIQRAYKRCCAEPDVQSDDERRLPVSFQAKLAISQPDDQYEQEADGVAERIMRMPAPCNQPKCTAFEEDTSKVRRQARDISQASVETAPAIVSAVIGSGRGRPLDSSTRAFFEPRFGLDFSAVRIHTDTPAAESARSVNASAYTVGRDIVFGAGKYSPTTSAGQHLLAHELTHVVQQSPGGTITRNQASSNQADLRPAWGPATASHSPSTMVVAAQTPMVQRQIGGLTPEIGGMVLSHAWLKLPRAVKLVSINLALDAVVALLRKIPADEAVGDAWTLIKEGLIAFFTRVKTADVNLKLIAVDKAVKIFGGQSWEYVKGLLLGLVKGFFLDGLLGIFIAIWDLIKALPKLWEFLKKVEEIVEGFPVELQNLLNTLKNMAESVLGTMDPAAELRKLIADPKRIRELLDGIVTLSKGLAAMAGQKIAEALLEFLSKKSAEFEIGESVGRVTGMVLFEVIFAVFTAGGGAAVSGVKAAARFLASLGSKIVGSILKVFRELHAFIEVAIDGAKAAVRFLKEEALAKVGKKIGAMLQDIKNLIARFLNACHESTLVCNFPKRIATVIAEMRKLARQGVPGANKLAKLIESAAYPAFREGLVFQAQRAIEYAKLGKLKAIEVTEVIGGKITRFDMIIEDLGKVVGGKANKLIEIVIETKNWTGFPKLSALKKRERLAYLAEQLDKFLASGRPVILEWKGPVPPEVLSLLKNMKKTVILKSI